MTNQQQLDLLKQGSATIWNKWREEHPDTAIELNVVDLSEANLGEVNLSEADLRESNLSAADLNGANLSKARLIGADLSGANLAGADLSDTDLSEANLYNADLTRCQPRGSQPARCDFGRGSTQWGHAGRGAHHSRTTESRQSRARQFVASALCIYLIV